MLIIELRISILIPFRFPLNHAGMFAETDWIAIPTVCMSKNTHRPLLNWVLAISSINRNMTEQSKATQDLCDCRVF